MQISINAAVMSFLAAASILAAPGASAQDAAMAPLVSSWISQGAASIDRSEVFAFKSAINGNSYKIFVSLPAGYEKSEERYPALYLLDGNQSWLYGRSAIDRIADDIPPMILVTIGYEGKSERWTDYGTPAKSYWDIPGDRGASVFLRVIKEEIFPFVEQKYRVDPTDRGLGGHSMGGFFSMWALFNTPETFQRYWISSPTVKWDNFILRELADKFARNHATVNARVYSDVGGLEDVIYTEELESLRKRATTGTALQWVNRVTPGIPHSGLPAAEIVPALYQLYGRPIASVPASRLRDVSGTYQLSDKTRFTLSTDGKSLFLGGWRSEKFPMVPAPERVPVLAETADIFYVRMVGLEFKVTPGQRGKVAELSVARHFFSDPMVLGTAKRVER